MLSAPLRERFGIFHHLDFYSDEELTRDHHPLATILEARVDAPARARSRGAHGGRRVSANRLLRRVRDYAQVKADGAITEAVARDALRTRGRGRAAGSTSSIGVSSRRSWTCTAAGRSAWRRWRQRSTTRRRRSRRSSSPNLLKIGFVAREPRGRA